MFVNEIDSEIVRLEQSEANYQNCNKLAVLYVIRDHMEKPKQIAGYSNSSSEFLHVVGGAPLDGVLRIMDEHMECLKALYPKEYSAILNRIREL